MSAENDVGLRVEPTITAVVTVRDKDGNIKYQGPITLIPISQETISNGDNPHDGG